MEAPHPEAPGAVRRQREQRKIWARAFVLVSTGTNGHASVTGPRIE